MRDLSNIILHFFITHMIPYAKPNTRQSLLAQMVICKGYKIETQFGWRILMEFDSDYFFCVHWHETKVASSFVFEIISISQCMKNTSSLALDDYSPTICVYDLADLHRQKTKRNPNISPLHLKRTFYKWIGRYFSAFVSTLILMYSGTNM